jgi:hypothetical protein
MADPMRIRVVRKGDVADVKMLIFHPMETGYRTHSATGEIVPKRRMEPLGLAQPVSAFSAAWSQSR